MTPLRWMAKTVRGAGTDEKQAPHLLSFRTHHSQETLLQIEVEEKTNEIPIALAYLAALPVAGRVFTADALHTHVPFFPAGPTVRRGRRAGGQRQPTHPA